MIKFSVLMSVYIKEKGSNLKESIDSLLNQTVKPNEIVIVEDGPLTKELYEVLDSYGNQIKRVSFKTNRGLALALRDGIKYCKYNYIARMDTDDICFKDRFEKQIKYLEEHKNVDVLGSQIIEFDDVTNKDISYKRVPLTKKEINKYVKKRNPINHMTVIYKKEAVLKSGNYENCILFEDYYLWAKMVKKGLTINNLDDVLVRVRAGKSLSRRRGGLKAINNIINFQSKLYEIGIINKFERIYNIFVRSLISILPNNIRYNFYQRNLRDEL